MPLVGLLLWLSVVAVVVEWQRRVAGRRLMYSRLVRLQRKAHRP